MLIDDVDDVTRIEIEFLLSCLQKGASYKSGGRIMRVMRTASEALHFVQYHSPAKANKYKTSTELKRVNLFVSCEASRLIAGSRKDFEGSTILEHPLPLEKMYFDLKELATPTTGSIVEMLTRYPLITVTKIENGDLKHSGWTSPVERYDDAKIKVGRVEAIEFGTEPVWKKISLSDPASWRVGVPLS
jgi:hypothetical protein